MDFVQEFGLWPLQYLPHVLRIIVLSHLYYPHVPGVIVLSDLSCTRYRVKSTSLLSGRTCLEKILATTVLILVVFCFLVTMIAVNVRK